MLWVVLDRERRGEKRVRSSPVAAARLRSTCAALLREVLIVPESKLAGDLLIEMRTRRASLAMVVDEFGSILGLLTLEDLLEQVVGEIHDEYDVVEARSSWAAGSSAAMVFDGGFGLQDLETQYDIALPDDPAYATLGGFVLAHLGFIPRAARGSITAITTSPSSKWIAAASRASRSSACFPYPQPAHPAPSPSKFMLILTLTTPPNPPLPPYPQRNRICRFATPAQPQVKAARRP